MKRKIMTKLLAWSEQTGERMPVLIYGARQVGKTYVMRELGEEHYKNTIYINFEMDEKISAYFEVDIHPDYLIPILEKYFRAQIVPEDTLIIFDEIQMCERALTSLKYFTEEAPEYHVIAAGSLLGVALNHEKYSFPVGKVQMLTMYPMDLEEVLWAKGKEALVDMIRIHFEKNQPMKEVLHNEALQEFQHYCIVGGMPAAVNADIARNSPIRQDEIRQMLLNSYIADMTKYADRGDTVRIFAAYDSLPMQLAKDSKKFQYKLIKSGARASQYGDAIDWLIHAGIVNKCMKCSQGFFPVAAYQDLTAFKLYYSDMGIMSARMGMTLEAMQSRETEHFRGILTENYVSVALKTNGYNLNYWESDNTAEVDFLIQKDNHVIPVECKAGDHVKAKSLMVYMNKYEPAYAVRISTRNFGFVNNIKSVPLYSVFCL
ncbi:MAG: ATP-binding protein [Lachnospiraceae bacterium]|nr:ATP-binding protein [Lachnospiraceae bacterium]